MNSSEIMSTDLIERLRAALELFQGTATPTSASGSVVLSAATAAVVHGALCVAVEHLVAADRRADLIPQALQPVSVDVVATIVRDTGCPCPECLSLDWLIEGGIAALSPGDVLLVADRPVTDGAGSGRIYAAPVDLPHLARR